MKANNLYFTWHHFGNECPRSGTSDNTHANKCGMLSFPKDLSHSTPLNTQNKQKGDKVNQNDLFMWSPSQQQ